MGRQRIIVDIENVGQARKIEETVESGYLEATIEHLLQWIAVEEDLISSYDTLGARGGEGGRGEAFSSFSRNSRENLKHLNEFLRLCEQMQKERMERISLLGRLANSGTGH